MLTSLALAGRVTRGKQPLTPRDLALYSPVVVCGVSQDPWIGIVSALLGDSGVVLTSW